MQQYMEKNSFRRNTGHLGAASSHSHFLHPVVRFSLGGVTIQAFLAGNGLLPVGRSCHPAWQKKDCGKAGGSAPPVYRRGVSNRSLATDPAAAGAFSGIALADAFPSAEARTNHGRGRPLPLKGRHGACPLPEPPCANPCHRRRYHPCATGVPST